MSSVTKKAALLAAGFLVFAGGTASAGVVDVKVPFPFVVQGQSFPAGQYRVENDPLQPSVVLIRGERGTKVNMFVLTMPAGGHDPAGDKPALAFNRYENQYRLSDVWESAGEGREIVPLR
jgi:hypothetical protein